MKKIGIIVLMVVAIVPNVFALKPCVGQGGGVNNCDGRSLDACSGYYRTSANGGSAQCRVEAACEGCDSGGRCSTSSSSPSTPYPPCKGPKTGDCKKVYSYGCDAYTLASDKATQCILKKQECCAPGPSCSTSAVSVEEKSISTQKNGLKTPHQKIKTRKSDILHRLN